MSDFHALVNHLDTTATVTVVTTRPSGTEVATPIWTVTVDGVPFVRSAYGDRAVWHRHARSGRPAWFTLADGANAERDPKAALADPRVAVTFAEVAPDDPDQPAVEAAYQAKYGHTPHIGAVTTDDARRLTLRVEPA